MTHIPDEAVQAKRNLIQSYNWSFRSTGIDAIDNILSSISDAAESYHNTSQWEDEGHIDRIQKYADVAAYHLSAPCAEKTVDVSEVRRHAFEEGFENGVEQSLNALDAYDDITRNEAEQGIRKLKPDYRALSAEPAQVERKYKLGDRLTKTKGSKWTGRVVGFYSTNLTPIGYAIESETETGSVQIYPEAALTSAEPEAGK